MKGAAVSVAAISSVAAAQDVTLLLPENVTVTKTKRGSDPGYGVDLNITAGKIRASILDDDDGDAYFVMQRGDASCKFDIGCDPMQDGFKVEVFQQTGLDCQVSKGVRRGDDFVVGTSVSEKLDGTANCDSSVGDSSGSKCDKVWRFDPSKPAADESAQEVTFLLPENVRVTKTKRGGDPGYGVDLDIKSGKIRATILDDDDGDAYFVMQRGDASCKFDIGCDPMQDGFKIEVFQQTGLDCQVSKGVRHGDDFVVSTSISEKLDGTANCDSSFGDSSGAKCDDKVWRFRPSRLAAASASDAKPESWALWTAKLQLPEGATARKIPRGGDHGYGVDLSITDRTVDANVWDDDGDAFFEVSKGSGSCSIDVGSNGLGPGLTVEVFKQKGLQCQVSRSTGGPKDYVLSLAADDDLAGSADCDSTLCPGGACPEQTAKPCSSTWHAPSQVASTKTALRSSGAPASWALWTAKLSLPSDVTFKKVGRAGDGGYGVDIKNVKYATHQEVDASIWDDDGSAFFEVRRGAKSCKLSVGSNGLGPGLEVETYQQRGLECSVLTGTGGPKDYKLTMVVRAANGQATDCDSTACPDGACPAGTKNLCNKVWRASGESVIV
eukprot:TRINITY_DN4088_c0_g1_i1.p1 TRINITY_DN4088_c0_g1~~TRINITY_DN4088_c0_g1_i1.p1  ORF type:complete len:609 (+),score=173.22 TRINITY_DN4088_c0_g1_i1:59-1885(+)